MLKMEILTNIMKSNMAKVIIIGAKGMLGQEMTRLFELDEKYEVLSWDFEEIDIVNEAQVNEKVSVEKPDIIINCAAYNNVDAAEENAEEFEKAKKVNGEGPKYLAKVAKKVNAVFVQFVTDYLFDGEKGEYTEDDKTSPISNYGISKELGEQNVQKVDGKYYLIRISKLFGRPARSESAKKSFFEVMSSLAKEKDELKVVDSERACFTYAPDLVRATKTLVEDKYAYGIYHLVNEGAVTWYEGVLKLFEIADIKNVEVVAVGSGEFPLCQ